MTSSKTHRINARLPPEVARKVAYLEKHTHMSTTQILLESIDHYYAAVTSEEEGSAAEKLKRAGFVGCASGAADLSSSYKEELSRTMGHKT